MRNRVYIVIMLLAAFVGGLLLYSAPLRAADPRSIACPNGQTVFLEGEAPPGEALLAYLRGRPVGGGLADAAGHYRLPLRADERPGAYPVEVRLRSSRTVLDSFICFVDIAVGSDPAPTQTLEGAAPVATGTARSVASPTVAGTVVRQTTAPAGSPSPTRTGTVLATGTTVTTGTPAGGATPTATRGTATPTITGTTSVTSSVVIQDIYPYDPVYPDTVEYVEIHNNSRGAINISGWKLSNATRGSAVPTYIFPTFTLGVDFIIIVYSEAGDDVLDGGEFFWDQTNPIWRVGDVAELRDSQNNLITTFTVTNPS